MGKPHLRNTSPRRQLLAPLSLFGLLSIFSGCKPPETTPLGGASQASLEPAPLPSATTTPSPSPTPSAPPSPVPACTATPVSNNTAATPLRTGVDEIEAGAFYVAYSGQNRSTANGWALRETSNDYVIKGTTTSGVTEVWIFGAGYGDDEGGGSDLTVYKPFARPSRNGSNDAADIHHIISSCMGLTPSQARIRFIAPHGHVDHVNQEFFTALFNTHGYASFDALMYIHVNDAPMLGKCQGGNLIECCGAGGSASCSNSAPFWGAPYSPPWDPAILSKFSAGQIGNASDTCDTVIFTFPSATGNWSVTRGTDHTSGTLNLVNGERKYRVLGAKDFGACPAPAGYTVLDTHGLLVL